MDTESRNLEKNFVQREGLWYCRTCGELARVKARMSVVRAATSGGHAQAFQREEPEVTCPKYCHIPDEIY